MKKKKGTFRQVLKWLLLAAFLVITVFTVFFVVNILRLDAWRQFDVEKITGAPETLIVYDASGDEVLRLHSTQDRVRISIDDIPQNVRYAFISAEDARFYEHIGIDIIRIAGAAWEDIKAGGYVQGASTISQQLIKLSHLSSEKTMTRKVEEAIIAYQMEKRCSKDEILEMYLNYVYFGGGYYGIEAAALGYFGVHAGELTTAQACMLAGTLKSPTKYAPHLDINASTKRRDMIIGLMYEYGHITETEHNRAIAEKPVIIHSEAKSETTGYYLDCVLSDAIKVLNINMDELLTGGYRVYSVLDSELQAQCEHIFENGELFPTEDCEAAIAVQRAGTGEVIALVGGRSAYVERGFNRAVDMRRQPGSVIKPVIAYAAALEKGGYTAATMILDEPTSFGDYAPGNFANKYYGWVTLREAVTRSLNVPAVKVLSEIGVNKGKDFAQSCGIIFDESDTSLTLALGGFTYGVSPWQVTAAYNCFASGGVYHEPTVLSRITDTEGNTIYEYKSTGRQVISEQNSYILTSMLQSAISDGTGHRLGELNIPLAGKTGTVGEGEGNRDAWMAAYNSEYTASVWMGYDDASNGQALPENATGGRYPALVLSSLFSYLYDDVEPPEFIVPNGVTQVKLDGKTLEKRHSAVLATALTPKTSIVTEVFVDGTQPDDVSDYWVVPQAPLDFRVFLNELGNAQIEFTPIDSYVIYKLYRDTQLEKGVLIGEWRDVSEKICFIDEAAPPGEMCTYYIQPVHPEMKVGPEPVVGPHSRRLSVIMPVVILPKAVDVNGLPSFSIP